MHYIFQKYSTITALIIKYCYEFCIQETFESSQNRMSILPSCSRISVQVRMLNQRRRPDNKTKMYKIQFNEMVQINDAEKITSFLFDQHSLHFNEQNVPYEQILETVQLILSNQKFMKSSSLSFKKKSSPFTYDQPFSDEDIDLI
ncbi:unnamed protein product [Paramecium sonneborni]|uniref:Uncharacterized protein n=1 Tax=Paramecium sonneborni TaxID=65129 RepID=A0A8S1KGW8_9CILI|nr:unnamed protein product [Paramecium sonneborni]